jgi:hypothetical protein
MTRDELEEAKSFASACLRLALAGSGEVRGVETHLDEDGRTVFIGLAQALGCRSE